MIAAEELAKEIVSAARKSGVAICAPKVFAEALIPFIQSRAAAVQGADELLRSENPDRKDFTVDEALRIADQNDAAYKHVPSVSRTLAAEVRRLATPQPPKDAGAIPPTREDMDTPYFNRMREADTAELIAANKREAAARAQVAVGKWADDDFYARHPLPVLHDDPATNAEILIQALCDRLDTARRALADAAAMQVVQPTLSQIKANAAWAMNETDPRRLLPRSASYTLVEAQEKSDPSPAHAEALAREVGSYQSEITGPGGRCERFTFTRAQFAEFTRRLAGGGHA